MQNKIDSICEKLFEFLVETKKLGAQASEAIWIKQQTEDVSLRNKKLESSQLSDTENVGIRLIVDGKQTIMSQSFHVDETNLKDKAKELIEFAKHLPADPFAKVLEPSYGEDISSQLQLFDNSDFKREAMINDAMEIEEQALSHSHLLQTSSVTCQASKLHSIYVNSNEFLRKSNRTNFYKAISMSATKDDSMQRDYAYSNCVFLEDLDNNNSIAKEVANNTLTKLNKTTPLSGELPIVFSPRVARQLIGNVIQMLNGNMIAQKNSLFCDKLGEQIFANSINIINNPHKKRGLASRVYDSEGQYCSKFNLIADGRIANYLLDSRSAMQLNMQTNACASRSTASLPRPSAHNISIVGAEEKLNSLMQQAKGGIYITDMMGMGINTQNGDFSQAAAGFIINEDGSTEKYIEGFTISSHLSYMLKHLILADDMQEIFTINSPTIYIDKMQVSS